MKAEREAVYAQEDEYKQKAIDEGAKVNQIDREPFIKLAEPLQEKAAKDMGAEDLLEKSKNLSKNAR